MKGNKKNWIAIWLVVFCAAWLVTGTYAAYTKVDSIKRVVSTTSGAEVRFSSNHMTLKNRTDEESTYKLTAITSGSASSVSVSTTVCNFPQGDAAKSNPNTIAYRFTAELLDIAGNAVNANSELSYSDANGNQVKVTGAQIAAALKINNIFFTTVDNGACCLEIPNQQLTGGEAHQNVYKLTCEAENAAMLDAVMIQMKAIPTDPTSCGIGSDQFLAGRLRVLMNSGRSTVWTGRFTDMGVTNTPGELDAFNYEISGTAKGTYVLSWNKEKVALSPWFLEDLPAVSIQKQEAGMVQISVGEPGTPTSYRFVFYRVGGIPEGETWDTVRGYVTFAPANG